MHQILKRKKNPLNFIEACPQRCESLSFLWKCFSLLSVHILHCCCHLVSKRLLTISLKGCSKGSSYPLRKSRWGEWNQPFHTTDSSLHVSLMTPNNKSFLFRFLSLKTKIIEAFVTTRASCEHTTLTWRFYSFGGRPEWNSRTIFLSDLPCFFGNIMKVLLQIYEDIKPNVQQRLKRRNDLGKCFENIKLFLTRLIFTIDMKHNIDIYQTHIQNFPTESVSGLHAMWTFWMKYLAVLGVTLDYDWTWFYFFFQEPSCDL